MANDFAKLNVNFSSKNFNEVSKQITKLKNQVKSLADLTSSINATKFSSQLNNQVKKQQTQLSQSISQFNKNLRKTVSLTGGNEKQIAQRNKLLNDTIGKNISLIQKENQLKQKYINSMTGYNNNPSPYNFGVSSNLPKNKISASQMQDLIDKRLKYIAPNAKTVSLTGGDTKEVARRNKLLNETIKDNIDLMQKENILKEKMYDLSKKSKTYYITDEKLPVARKILPPVAKQPRTSEVDKYMGFTATYVGFQKGKDVLNNMFNSILEIDKMQTQLQSIILSSSSSDSKTANLTDNEKIKQSNESFGLLKNQIYEVGKNAMSTTTDLFATTQLLYRSGVTLDSFKVDINKFTDEMSQSKERARQFGDTLRTVSDVSYLAGESAENVADGFVSILNQTSIFDNASSLVGDTFKFLGNSFTTLLNQTSGSLSDFMTSMKYGFSAYLTLYDKQLREVSGDEKKYQQVVENLTLKYESMLGVLQKHGISGSIAGTSMRQIETRIAGNAKTNDILQSMGIRTMDTKGNVRDISTILGDYYNYFYSKNAKGKFKTNIINRDSVFVQLANQMFGETAENTALILAKASAQMKGTNGDMKTDMDRMFKSLKDISEKGSTDIQSIWKNQLFSSTLSGSLQPLTATWAKFISNLDTLFTPAFIGINLALATGIGYLNSFTNWLIEFNNGFSGWNKNIVSFGELVIISGIAISGFVVASLLFMRTLKKMSTTTLIASKEIQASEKNASSGSGGTGGRWGRGAYRKTAGLMFGVSALALGADYLKDKPTLDTSNFLQTQSLTAIGDITGMTLKGISLLAPAFEKISPIVSKIVALGNPVGDVIIAVTTFADILKEVNEVLKKFGIGLDNAQSSTKDLPSNSYMNLSLSNSTDTSDMNSGMQNLTPLSTR